MRRWRVEESPAFKRLERTNEKVTSPLVTVLRKYRKQVVLMAGAYLVHGVVIYGAAVYSLSYGTTNLDFSYSQMLLLILLCQIVVLILIPTFANIGDKVGIKKVFLIGNIGMGLMGIPWVLLLDTGSFGLALLGYLLIFIPYAATYGTMAAFFASIYDSRVGYSGISMGYQLGSIIGSGLTPLAAAALIASTGTVLTFGVYIGVAAVLSVAATIYLTAHVGEPDEVATTTEPDDEMAVSLRPVDRRPV